VGRCLPRKEGFRRRRKGIISAEGSRGHFYYFEDLAEKKERHPGKREDAKNSKKNGKKSAQKVTS